MPFDKNGKWIPPQNEWMPQPKQEQPAAQIPQPQQKKGILDFLKPVSVGTPEPMPISQDAVDYSVPARGTPVTSDLVSAIGRLIEQQRQRNIESAAKLAEARGGTGDLIRRQDFTQGPEVLRQLAAGIAQAPPFKQLIPKEQIEQLGQAETTAGKIARGVGGYLGISPTFALTAPLGAAAKAAAVKLPLKGIIARLATQGAARGGATVGAAEGIKQLADLASGEQVTPESALKSIGAAVGVGAAFGAVINVATPYLANAFDKFLSKIGVRGTAQQVVTGTGSKEVVAGSEQYQSLLKEGWKPYVKKDGSATFLHKDGNFWIVKGEMPKAAPPVPKSPIGALEADVPTNQTIFAKIVRQAGTDVAAEKAIQQDALRAEIETVMQETGLPVGELLQITQQSLDTLIAEQVTVMQSEMGRGAEGSVIHEPGGYTKGYVIGHTGFHSLNADWYREFRAIHKREPRKAEMRHIAAKLLSEGYVSPDGGFIPPNENFVNTEGYLNAIRSIEAEQRGLVGEAAPGTPKTQPALPRPQAEGAAIPRAEARLADKVAATQAADTSIGLVPPSFRSQAPRGPDFVFADPQVEERFQRSHGLTPPTFADKAKELGQSLINKFTRVFESLPNTPEFAQIKNDLLKLSKQRAVASDRTLRIELGIISDLRKDMPAYNLFERKVLLDDLAEEAAAGRELPLGFAPETLAADKARLDAEIAKYPAVQKAIADRQQAWDAVKQDYIDAMNEIGFDVEDRFTKQNYFRHQVLQHANAKGLVGIGRGLRAPTGRGFLKARKGTTLDINTNYLQAEYEVMSQMLYDIEVAEVIKSVDDKYNIAKQVKADAKKQGIKDWREAIPEGYTLWQPREGNVFYLANSIPERIALKALQGAFPGLSADDVKKVLAMGGPRQEYVIKQELADTLDNLQKRLANDPVRRFWRGSMGAWKQYQLISPRRFFRYNARNLSGDAEAVAIGNPRTFLKVPQAVKELMPVFFKERPMTPEMREWFNRGGMESTLQVAEMGEIDNLKAFHDLLEKHADITAIPGNILRGYWRTARLATDFREGILRYAAYLDYLEQLQANNGVPKNFGASIPEEILAISDIRDRAFRLSNDLVGAYDEVSVGGQSLREYWAWFWSWQEVNMRRYFRLMRNAVIDPNVAVKAANVAGVVARTSPFVAVRVGTFVIKAAALWAALDTWNNLRFPEEERDLPEETKKKPHIILGRDKDGKVMVFTRLGILSDFLERFGIDGPPLHLVRDFLNGKKTAKQIAQEMGKAWVNETFQLMRPDIKTLTELAAGKSLYPDVFKGRPIRDTGLYFAEQFGLGDEYKAIAGLPARPYSESLKNLILYRYDTDQTAYYSIQDDKREFLKKIGKEGDYSGKITPRSQALYNFRLAIRFEDKEAAKKYLFEYARLGGTSDGLATSLRNMNPLHGLNQAEQVAFTKSLDKEQQQKLRQAVRFYNDVLLGRKGAAP